MNALGHGTRLHLAGEVAVGAAADHMSGDVAARREQRMPHPVRLTEVPRLGAEVEPLAPLSELVLVDQHEAQGWRVRQDERLDRLFEERCDWVRTYGRAGQLAVDTGDETLTYDELDSRSNQLARYLRLHGMSAGDRVGLLLDRSTDAYVAILAVLKIGAAYVPLNVGHPADRMAAVVDDARVRTVLSTSTLAARLEQTGFLTARGTELVHLDLAGPLIAEQDPRRLLDFERGGDPQLAYITYPHRVDSPLAGVAIDHRSICNFVKVAAEIYGIRPQDRVYQGMPLAFDFSVEEIWVPWACGATLVPRPAGASPRGRELQAFLAARRVTVLCCVPALLDTLEDGLPDLRVLLVAGGPCPKDLVRRWQRRGRRFLNVYGPAKATVSAMWTEPRPDGPVTLGVPLPTYSTVVLDVDDPHRALPHGQIGEVGIAGIGLACGYHDRDDLTGQVWIPDFLGIPANPAGRIYRTGELGRVNADGEIEYHGRVDRQDAVHGYRVDLRELESAVLPAASTTTVRPSETAPAAVNVAAVDVVDVTGLAEPPAGPAAPPEPAAGVERDMATVLAEVLGVDEVSVDGHFFDDLGADSMVMARFCARLRKRADLPSVSMKDVYARPTVRSLAVAFAPAAPAAPAVLAAPAAPPVLQAPVSLAPSAPVAPVAPPDPAAGVERDMAAVLAEVLGVGEVSVDGHFFDDLGADSMVMARFCARLRKRADLPSVSMKDVYARPTVRSLAVAFAPAAPAAPPVLQAPVSLAPSAPVAPVAPVAPPALVPGAMETGLAGVLAEVLGVGEVSVDGHFFDDLGADSMVMARFCARLRKRADLPSVSMKDVYARPTVRSLAVAFAPAAPPAPAAPTAVPAPADPAASTASVAPPSPMPIAASPVHVPTPVWPADVPTEAPKPVGTLQYVLCGSLQLLIFLGYTYVTVLIAVFAFGWITTAPGLVDAYLRSVVAGGSIFLGMCILPILAKWLLIGRWRSGQIRIWSLAYVRFWLVKTLVTANPLVLFNGSPLYTLYLRALGAKIGRGVLILTNHVPVCTDLITIGEGTVVRKDSFLTGYRAIGGVIQTGRVTLGRNVLLGEKAVLDIDTSMGDGSRLGHASALHAGQAVPAGRTWHGSPAEPTDMDYGAIVPPGRRASRGVVYSVSQLANLVFLYLPVMFGGVDILLASPKVQALSGPAVPELTTWLFYLEALVVAVVLVVAPIVVGLIVAVTVPRLLNLTIKPGKAYPLYGVRYSFHRSITRMTNSKFLMNLFGDSSYVVPYLLALGYKLRPVVQTGSNFASELKHDNPYLSHVGTGTVVASDLSIVNADYSSTSFRVSRTSIGANNFLGNIIAYPSQGRTGDNCLLGTKVMVPIDGEIRENVGLLGSPSFEIPRTVERDNRFNHLAGGDELRRRLAAKNRHNLVTIGLFLLARTFSMFVATLIGFVTVDLYPTFGVPVIPVAMLALLLFNVFYGVLIERASTGFRPLRPKYCSIYDVDFWRTERFFKLEAQVSPIFNGTPFKSTILRMLGVRVGRRLFDDGASMAEKNLVTLGDNVTLNAGSWVQCHSQEDNAFKSDRISIGSDCTVGIAAMILYSVTMEDGSVLAPDSFLMKGEEIPADERWGGNPARELPSTHPADVLIGRTASHTRAAALAAGN